MLDREKHQRGDHGPPDPRDPEHDTERLAWSEVALDERLDHAPHDAGEEPAHRRQARDRPRKQERPSPDLWVVAALARRDGPAEGPDPPLGDRTPHDHEQTEGDPEEHEVAPVHRGQLAGPDVDEAEVEEREQPAEEIAEEDEETQTGSRRQRRFSIRSVSTSASTTSG